MDLRDDGFEPTCGSCPPGSGADRAEAVATVDRYRFLVTATAAPDRSPVVAFADLSQLHPGFKSRQMFERGGLKGAVGTSWKGSALPDSPGSAEGQQARPEVWPFWRRLLGRLS